MMTFGSFMAKVASDYRKWSKDELDALRIPPMENTHVFYVGEDRDFVKAIEDIRPDLYGEMKERIPMPFKDVSIASIVRRVIDAEDEKMLVRDIFGEDCEGINTIPEGAPVWILDRLIEADESHPVISRMIQRGIDAGDEGNLNQVLQWFIFIRHTGYEGMKTAPLGWVVGYGGLEHGKIRIVSMELMGVLNKEVVNQLEQVAAISHPANYVIKVTPELTPRESRKIGKGNSRPDEKRVHFIVVDHDVLVGMRRGEGTHASPVPHERRGHWMRLAERCRHARLIGKDKVWVRPAFVGERVFGDTKNVYEVLLDFGKRQGETEHGGVGAGLRVGDGSSC